MKKIMLGTTALVGLSAVASGVQAADPLKCYPWVALRNITWLRGHNAH
ncbi:MAG: hypothetical protein R3E60_01660 [Alphaproteobacteria bacterium]